VRKNKFTLAKGGDVSERRVDEISIDELEQLIAERRAARVRGEEFTKDRARARRRALRAWANRLLTLLEIAIVLILVYSVVDWFRTRSAVNEVSVANFAQVIPTPTVAPAIGVAYLPGGHTPPNAPGGAQPIEASIPDHLRALVDVATPAQLPTVEPQREQAIRIQIPAIGVNAPVVLGDDWESLKLGVGQHIGSANPGERSNMVLSAHNDIYGEIFRHLDQMQLEDEVIVHTASRAYRYVVKDKRIIEPTQVEVMDPTRRSVVTLISCYPYLIDTQRIVVVGELVED
jgi:sortase A